MWSGSPRPDHQTTRPHSPFPHPRPGAECSLAVRDQTTKPPDHQTTFASSGHPGCSVLEVDMARWCHQTTRPHSSFPHPPPHCCPAQEADVVWWSETKPPDHVRPLSKPRQLPCPGAEC
eukprot:965377-Pyramimonas_sp.AAC.1